MMGQCGIGRPKTSRAGIDGGNGNGHAPPEGGGVHARPAPGPSQGPGGQAVRCRSRGRTRTGAAAAGPGRSRPRVLYSIHMSMTSWVKTSPLSRNSWSSFESAASASSREPGADGIFGQFLGRQVVDVLVQRLARVDLVLDAVEARHQHGGEGEVAVAGRVRGAELDALGLGRGGVHRDADGGAAVAARVGQVDRGLVAGHQPLVGVGGRVGEGARGRGRA